jgi:hypothetical protein
MPPYLPQPFFMSPQRGHSKQLQEFWQKQLEEVKYMGTSQAEFKKDQLLPLARIKKASRWHL